MLLSFRDHTPDRGAIKLIIKNLRNIVKLRILAGVELSEFGRTPEILNEIG
jgi:hypothetical protein